jgi:hypothetical protein
MGYTVSTWTKDTSAEKAQNLSSLFKGYSKVAEFAKVMIHFCQICMLKVKF